MSLKEIKNIKLEYRTLSDEVVDSFYIPCLKNATTYKRAVGFFSSSILLQLTEGLGAFSKNGGKMQLLVSPRLSNQDYDAIKNGYDMKLLVENQMLKDFDEEIDFIQKTDRFALLSYLISHDLLEIKVAVLEKAADVAIYHEKLGIMKDDDGDIISFTGSANETDAAFNLNYECIDVFCSWFSADAEQRCIMKDMRFDRMWKGNEKGLIILPFPRIIKEKILKYDKPGVDFVKLDEDFRKEIRKKHAKSNEPTEKGIAGFYDYQVRAIDEWEKQGYRGIFDMATGTGKTFTGCGAICRLYERVRRLVVIITCPYTHLVDQWCEEVRNFNISPVKCYGGSKYKKDLQRQLEKFKHRRTDFVCIIVSNGTFQTKSFQEIIDGTLTHTLLVADEAHNIGATKISRCLNKDYPYRLALSATLERHGDEKGTKKIFDFFGDKCIEYDLGRAIQEQKLTPYKYYPVLVSLTEDELEQYEALSEKIGKYFVSSAKGDLKNIPETLKLLLIRRARIIAGAENKLPKLLEIIEPYKNKNNLLVYCGAVKYEKESILSSEDDEKQIQKVTEALIGNYKMTASKFTAAETNEQRMELIDGYKEGVIQCLVAIKCLDEGVNVPSIKTAFILASSTNPKEYIQRRGRVLRKSKGKDYAEIYDFVTLPYDINAARRMTFDKSVNRSELSLVQKELTRVIDFAGLAMNASECIKVIDEVKEAFNMYELSGGYEEYE